MSKQAGIMQRLQAGGASDVPFLTGKDTRHLLFLFTLW